jgi:hypothetical protein
MLRATLFVSALLWACGETAEPGPDLAHGGSSTVPQGGIDAGGGRDAGPGSVAGDAGSLVGAGGLAVDAGPLGGQFNGGGSEDAGRAGSDLSSAGDGGAAGAIAETPSLCALVVAHGENPRDVSQQIGANYRHILDFECRYTGLKCGVDFAKQIAFANELIFHGLDLWHCDGLTAQEFRLTYRDRAVTRVDAEALVELYVTLTMKKLLLSDSDAAGLRKELLGLMTTSLAADAPSMSLCDSGGVCPANGAAGGAGTGGTGGASAGTGGTQHHAGAG